MKRALTAELGFVKLLISMHIQAEKKTHVRVVYEMGPYQL